MRFLAVFSEICLTDRRVYRDGRTKITTCVAAEDVSKRCALMRTLVAGVGVRRPSMIPRRHSLYDTGRRPGPRLQWHLAQLTGDVAGVILWRIRSGPAAVRCNVDHLVGGTALYWSSRSRLVTSRAVIHRRDTQHLTSTLHGYLCIFGNHARLRTWGPTFLFKHMSRTGSCHTSSLT